MEVKNFSWLKIDGIQGFFKKLSLKKLIVAVILLLGVLFIVTQAEEVQEIASTFKQGDWRFILLAVAAEAIWAVCVAVAYKLIYRLMGMQESTQKLLLTLASTFVNVVAPLGGLSGLGVMFAEAREKGFSSGKVSLSGILFTLLDYASFLCILVGGLWVLINRNALSPVELAASIALLTTAAAISFLIYLGMSSTGALVRILDWTAINVNRLLWPLLHHEYFSENRVIIFASDAGKGLGILRRKPLDLLAPTLITLISKGLLVLVLFLVFLSFKVPFSAGTLVAAFSIGYLFMVVSPTPSGIGLAEGALTLALNSLHVPLQAAAVVALAFRGITFWLPLLGGMFAFRWLLHHPKSSLPSLSAGS